MATALLEPLVTSDRPPVATPHASDVWVYDVIPESMHLVAESLKVTAANSLSDAVTDADLVVCAVKPQNLTPAFLNTLRLAIKEDAIFLSVIAGTPLSVFAQHLPHVSKLVRSMPNTPAQVGQGMTVWSCTDALDSQHRQAISLVLNACGASMYVDSEDFIDMATSISGSGPAYIFLLMESLIDGAVHMGFPRDQATTLVYHTMLGSTLYAMETAEHPAILRNRVTSPSGTTASALYELENGKIRTTVKDAMWACYRRSLEMGDHDSNVGPGRTQQQ